MWNRVDWMKPLDGAILNFLSPPKPLRLSPANIAENIEYNAGYVADRCKVLVDKGLLTAHHKGDPFYETTEFGNRFARGEVEPDELIEDED